MAFLKPVSFWAKVGALDPTMPPRCLFGLCDGWRRTLRTPSRWHDGDVALEARYCLSTDKRSRIVSALVRVIPSMQRAGCWESGSVQFCDSCGTWAAHAPRTIIRMSAICACAASSVTRFGRLFMRSKRTSRLNRCSKGRAMFGRGLRLMLIRNSWVSYALGDGGAGTAKAFMQDVASRISSRIQLHDRRSPRLCRCRRRCVRFRG